MAIPLPPLDAFRADREQATQPVAQEGVWLQVALLAHRAAALPPHERSPHLARIQGLLAFATGDVFDALIASALRMEDEAAFQLALSTLDATLRVLPSSDVDRRGLAMAYQARVLRQLGEPTAAEARYDAVIELGESGSRPALVARGIAGLGLLAQSRGNLPEARQCFNRALRIDESAVDTRRVAHQGLMQCAASAGDLSTAARHAWSAYVDSEGADRAAALIDLSEILLRAGNERAALSGFTEAVRRQLLPRYELPALGGLAVAAARGAPEAVAESLVRASDRRLETLLSSCTLTFLQASALADVGDAYSEIGDDDRAAVQRRRARALASQHGYHEILFRVEAAIGRDAKRAAPAATYEVGAPSEIVEAVQSIVADEELAEAALALSVG